MTVIHKICSGIGLVSEWSGRVVMFLVFILMVEVAYDVFARYLFNAPTTWSYALSYMLCTAIIALGLPYVYYHNANVRIDLIYSKLSPKRRLILDVVLTIVLFFPLLFMVTKLFGQDAWQAYVTSEIDHQTMWYQPLWPFKMVVTLGFALLFLQGIVTFVKDVMSLAKRGNEPW